jgi:hypothetical protein
VVPGAARRAGTAECWKSAAAFRVGCCRADYPFSGPAAAITIGHVVLAQSSAALAQTRRHERVHVAQYERWGGLFLLAYPLASLWAGLRGKHPYLDNVFEVEARAGKNR